MNIWSSALPSSLTSSSFANPRSARETFGVSALMDTGDISSADRVSHNRSFSTAQAERSVIMAPSLADFGYYAPDKPPIILETFGRTYWFGARDQQIVGHFGLTV